MDEPTGNLDEQTGESVRELIESLRDQIGIAFVLVTHDMAMARSLGRVLRLEQGETVSGALMGVGARLGLAGGPAVAYSK